MYFSMGFVDEKWVGVDEKRHREGEKSFASAGRATMGAIDGFHFVRSSGHCERDGSPGVF